MDYIELHWTLNPEDKCAQMNNTPLWYTNVYPVAFLLVTTTVSLCVKHVRTLNVATRKIKRQ